MAFCPNCGTPNTDQADKCVSCGFELEPKQKAKFKGTIMMSGVQAPGMPAKAPAPAPQPAAPPPAAAPQPIAPAAPTGAQQPAGMGGGKNLAFEKTMLGGMAPVVPPPAQTPSTPTQDFARAATIEGPAPIVQPAAPVQPASFTPPVQASPAAPPQSMGGFGGTSGSAGGFSSDTGGFGGGGGGGYSNTGGFGAGGHSDSLADARPPTNKTGKYLAIGCAAVLALFCVIGGLLFFVAREKLNALLGAAEKEGDALEWRGSLAQSLTQVAALCQTNCASASVFFHPEAQGPLLVEAQQLTPARVQKLVDPTQSEARMLSATDDTALAQNLNLDPQQCVRVVSAGAKVVGCSVPDANGNASLRIVAMSGINSL